MPAGLQFGKEAMEERELRAHFDESARSLSTGLKNASTGSEAYSLCSSSGLLHSGSAPGMRYG